MKKAPIFHFVHDFFNACPILRSSIGYSTRIATRNEVFIHNNCAHLPCLRPGLNPLPEILWQGIEPIVENSLQVAKCDPKF